MTDFLKELEGKAYALVSDMMTLDEFKSWYALAMAAKVQPVAIESTDAPTAIPVRLPPAVKADEPEDDYRPSQPRLDDGSQPDPEWAVGTGDADRKRERGQNG